MENQRRIRSQKFRNFFQIVILKKSRWSLKISTEAIFKILVPGKSCLSPRQNTLILESFERILTPNVRTVTYGLPLFFRKKKHISSLNGPSLTNSLKSSFGASLVRTRSKLRRWRNNTGRYTYFLFFISKSKVCRPQSM